MRTVEATGDQSIATFGGPVRGSLQEAGWYTIGREKKILVDQLNELAVRCDGLRKRYGDVVAVDDLTVHVRRGEFFGLVFLFSVLDRFLQRDHIRLQFAQRAHDQFLASRPILLVVPQVQGDDVDGVAARRWPGRLWYRCARSKTEHEHQQQGV